MFSQSCKDNLFRDKSSISAKQCIYKSKSLRTMSWVLIIEAITFYEFTVCYCGVGWMTEMVVNCFIRNSSSMSRWYFFRFFVFYSQIWIFGLFENQCRLWKVKCCISWLAWGFFMGSCGFVWKSFPFCTILRTLPFKVP